MKPKIVCHGGVLINSRKATNKRSGEVDRAAQAGYNVMREGGTALDAVTEAVSYLEDSPEFNAGTGSYIQMDGSCRMDACIMDSDLNVGALIEIEKVQNPIRVARRLLEKRIPAVLSGNQATGFAQLQGFPAYDPRTAEKLDIWLAQRWKLKKYQGEELLERMRAMSLKKAKLGTVGAVAIDAEGKLAAATSTGGLSMDLPGRVGDVPLVGCGNYANPQAAVSCTGIGEKIIRIVLAREVVYLIEKGQKAQTACDLAIKKIQEIDGRAGLIAIDHKGRVGIAHNATAMATSVIE